MRLVQYALARLLRTHSLASHRRATVEVADDKKRSTSFTSLDGHFKIASQRVHFARCVSATVATDCSRTISCQQIGLTHPVISVELEFIMQPTLGLHSTAALSVGRRGLFKLANTVSTRVALRLNEERELNLLFHV